MNKYSDWLRKQQAEKGRKNMGTLHVQDSLRPDDPTKHSRFPAQAGQPLDAWATAEARLQATHRESQPSAGWQGMQGRACRQPIQDILACATPAPAQGHRREDTLLAEVGSYLPRRCPPPVRLYSRLTGLHNRQTAPRWQVRASASACSLPRARTEETWGPQASQWRTNTTQRLPVSTDCSNIQAAHPPVTHPSFNYS